MLISCLEKFSVLIIVIGLRNGIAELARRIDVAAEKVGNSHTSLHTALPAEKNALNLVVLGKVFTVDERTRIYNDNRLFKSRRNPVDKTLFNFGKIVVAVNGTAVYTLGRKAAESNNCRVCFFCRRDDQLIGYVGFGNVHTCKGVVDDIILFLTEIHCIDYAPRLFNIVRGRNKFALILNIFLVVFDGRHINAELALRFFLSEAFKNVAGVSAVNIAASAAALYVFDSRLSEKSEPFTLFKRQSVVFVFKEHHSLACRFS